MDHIKYGIIPAGGLGTRFLPVSAAVPKEMFPVFDLPLISFAIEDLAQSGVDHIFIVVSPWKKVYFESFLNSSQLFETILSQRAQPELIKKIKKIKEWPRIDLIVQHAAQGLAQAIGLARPFLSKESFFVLLPDEVLLNPQQGSCQQILKTFLSQKPPFKSLVGLYEVDLTEVKNYGVAELGDSLGLNIFALKGLVEKPEPQQSPSSFILPGRYLFTPQFWDSIELELKELNSLESHKEIHITEALNRMAQKGELQGVLLQAQRFDTGQPQGLLDLSIYQSKNFKDSKDKELFKNVSFKKT